MYSLLVPSPVQFRITIDVQTAVLVGVYVKSLVVQVVEIAPFSIQLAGFRESSCTRELVALCDIANLLDGKAASYS